MSPFDKLRSKLRIEERIFGADPELPRSYFADDSDLVNEDPVDQARLLAGAQAAAVACEALAESFDRARAFLREAICGVWHFPQVKRSRRSRQVRGNRLRAQRRVDGREYSPRGDHG